LNYYKDLKVDRTATQDQIKRAYRRRAMDLHPDRVKNHKEDTTDQMKAVQEAYDCLADPDKRSYYDKHGEPPKKGPDIEAEARARISTLFVELGTQFQWQKGPYVESIRGLVEKGLIKAEGRISKLDVMYEALPHITPQIDGEENVFEDVLAPVKRQMEIDRLRLEHDIEVLEKVQELVKGYSDQWKKPIPGQQFYAQGTTTTL